MPSAWQLIPEGIMLQQERKKKADDWAMQQRRLLSQRWAEQQQKNLSKLFEDAWEKVGGFVGEMGQDLEELNQPTVPYRLSEKASDFQTRQAQAADEFGELSQDVTNAQAGALFAPAINKPLLQGPIRPDRKIASDIPTLEQAGKEWEEVPSSIGKTVAEMGIPSELALNVVTPLPALGLAKIGGKALGKAVPKVAKEAVEEVASKGKRFYHGTGSAFDRPDAAKFDPNGLYGPGYYLTDNPEVAGSYAGVVRPTVELKQIENELLDAQARLYQAQNPQNIGFGTTIVNPDKVQMYQQQVSALVEKLENLQTRPNTRAIDVPQDLRLLDAEAPVPNELLQKLDAWANKYNLDTLDYLDPYSKPANGHELWKDLARASEETDYPNLVLRQMGYDGIRYQGGKRIPMTDATGNPIEHEALVIFPESLNKIKNAISGTEGGRVSANMALDVGGGVAGAYSQYDPNASMEENLPRMGLGFAGGYGTMYGGRKGLAGLGVKKLPPDFILPDSGTKGGKILGPTGDVLKEVKPGAVKAAKDVTESAYTGPVRRTTFARIWDRSRNVIARQGEGGRAIANMLVDSREKGETWAGDMMSRLPTVRSLTDREFEQFWDVAEGVPIPNISPKIRQAVHEWSYVRNEIYSRTIQNEMDIGFEDLYLPHEYDWKKLAGNTTKWNKAIEYLVKTKQADNRVEAAGKLRKMQDAWRDRPYGHLEFKREADFPDYKKSKDVLFRYIEGAAQRIVDIETFGKDMKNVDPLLDLIRKEGYDAETAQDMFKVATRGFSKGRWEPFFAGARMFNVFTKLGLGAISNAQQSVNTATVVGTINTVKAIREALTPEGYEYALKSGVILDGVIKQVRMGAGFEVGKLAAPFFNTVEIFDRTTAAIGGKKFAIDLAKKAAKGNKDAIAALNKMRLNGTDIATRGTLTEDEMIKASRNIVERTQYRVDPQDLPGWGSSTWGKLVTQFRTFSYNQTAFMKNEVIDPALKGNLGPLTRFLLLGMPIGALAYETRSAITQRNRPESTERLLLDYFMQVGGIGLVGDMIRGILPSEGGKYIDPGRRWAIMSSLVGGPTLQNAVDVVGSASDLAQGKPTYAERTALRQVPVVGQTLQNVIRPYKGNEPKQTGSGLQNYINKTKSGGNKSGLQKYIEKAKKGD